MTVLVCGSLTFDTIMTFAGKFSSHVLPEHLDVFNVAFTASTMRKEYGGCAGSICHGINMLGGLSYPVAAVGGDFESYFKKMRETGIPADYVKVYDEKVTAQSFLTTDSTGNQISTLYPGAMKYSDSQNIADIVEQLNHVDLGVISPDTTAAMVLHADQFDALGIPFLFDPGPEVIALSQKQLLRFISQAKWLIVNAYEWQIIRETTDLDADDILKTLDALIVTQGENGSEVFTKEKAINIAAVPVVSVVDPTGCGDAFRAGLIYGLVNDLDWQTTGQIGSLMGAINVQHSGAQNYKFTAAEFSCQYEAYFATSLPNFNSGSAIIQAETQ